MNKQNPLETNLKQVTRKNLPRVFYSFVMLVIFSITGCANFRVPEPLVSDISPQRLQRRQTTIDTFEKQRNDTMALEAKTSFLSGDLNRCRSLCEQILQRDAAHLATRHLLASLHMENEDWKQHEQQLRLILQHHPDDAAAHHALGLLLETSGRNLESVTHFQRAWQLQPQNALYVLSRPQADLSDEKTVIRTVGHQQP